MTTNIWEQIQSECYSCAKCRLSKTRHNVVFGDGNSESKIMFVGEGPGEKEDLSGLPFVGPAGKLLDDMLSIIDIDRSNCYIANIVKCRPPGNRDPQPDEQDACIGYLRRQFSIIQPQIIVCLGRIAAVKLIDPQYRISKQHGQWELRGNVWMTAIYHPSYLLRDPYKRPQAFEDLLLIRQKIQELGIDNH